MMRTIDLNSDLGETEDGLLDSMIMPYISSCNIACGGHFGNRETIKRALDEAVASGVAVGAHPAYPDRENFGRAEMAIAENDLRESILEQLTRFFELCKEQGISCSHVKPHGALYNVAARNENIAHLICEVVASFGDRMKLFGLAHSHVENIAGTFGLPFVAESFADRKYEADRTLMSRAKPGAVLEEAAVLEQVQHLVLEQGAESAEGWVSIKSKTMCLHSDTQGAVNLAQAIHQKLVQKGVNISAVQ